MNLEAFAEGLERATTGATSASAPSPAAGRRRGNPHILEGATYEQPVAHPSGLRSPRKVPEHAAISAKVGV